MGGTLWRVACTQQAFARYPGRRQLPPPARLTYFRDALYTTLQRLPPVMPPSAAHRACNMANVGWVYLTGDVVNEHF